MWNTEPEIGAAWGAFGAVFTSIAVAHTLYAPREVVLWNWRRIMLLGLSLALAVGSQFSLLLVVPLALILMLYVAPDRKAAAVAIWAAGCGLAVIILLAAYFFHPGVLVTGLRHANFAVPLRAFSMQTAYGRVFNQLRDVGPAFIVAMPVMIVAFLGWRRARYFGNATPLIIAVLFLLAAIGTPHFPGLGFTLVLLPFGFVFIAGVAADLLETKYRPIVLACVWGLLAAGAIWNVLQLARVRG